MNRIKKRTRVLGGRIKRKIEYSSLPLRQLAAGKQKNTDNKYTMKEMWENYLSFAALDF